MIKTVKAWTEEVSIPTYEVGKPEKNPMFLEKRVYQGSSGVVYPYPVIEKIYDQKKDKRWKAIFIENAFLKIMILPELGGRIQMAYDKLKGRHFIYHNSVIKPALVGLTGPWISGGIEFNWPQHHRPSTFDPVDSSIEENEDGSITVWCSEIERMFRTKGMAGFTLYPDRAYLEIKVKLYNRTPLPQTFLWWANPAVKVNDHYQSVFPPDVNAVYDHGKRDVSSFPIATGTYYKVDYSEGVDISRYKNIPVPTSYMAIKSNYDFIGCYEHDTKGGMLHVADHHISPGKKQWTWGNGDFGHAWDRNLTDEDGPYIELMCGVYTDNQPDFSWLMPCEEKSFSQFFLPYRDLGMVKNATKDILLNLEFDNNQARIAIYATREHQDATIRLMLDNKVIYETKANLTPAIVFENYIGIDSGAGHHHFKVIVTSKHGNTLIDWSPEKKGVETIPEPAKPALEPKEIKHTEQLYLTGLHLEQYRHATFSPSDYYLEALRRDPGDVRCNNAMGLLVMRKGNFELAEQYFRKAIETLTQRNPNPIDGEPYYNLGLALRLQNKELEAFEAFFKAVWNDAWQAAGYFQLALIATKKNQLLEAIELVDKSLHKQWCNHKARHLKTTLLRLTGKNENAKKIAEESLRMDRFNTGVMYEQYLLLKDAGVLRNLQLIVRNNIHQYIEIALDYAWAGLLNEAATFLKLGIACQESNVYPMAWYYLGWFRSQLNQHDEALGYYRKGEDEKPDGCFPNQLESVLALHSCQEYMKGAAKAPYYLGNFYYHNREYEKAMVCWEQSCSNGPNFATAHRNLALAYFNKAHRKEDALVLLERAFELDPHDARVFMELDALYKRLNKDYEFRLQLMDKYPDLVDFRDDLYLEKVALLNLTNRPKVAFDMLMERKFHPWEGGEGKVTGQYVLCLIELAKECMRSNDYHGAIGKLTEAKTYPPNLGEGKLFVAQENDIDFLMGYCYEKVGNSNASRACYEAASQGPIDLSPAMFYNDQQPDKILYQGLALLKLSKPEESWVRFDKLIGYGENHLNDKVKIDYFAVSLPDLMIWEDDLNMRNYLHCKYLIALGRVGTGNAIEASEILAEILLADNYHSGAFVHLKMLKDTPFYPQHSIRNSAPT